MTLNTINLIMFMLNNYIIFYYENIIVIFCRSSIELNLNGEKIALLFMDFANSGFFVRNLVLIPQRDNWHLSSFERGCVAIMSAMNDAANRVAKKKNYFFASSHKRGNIVGIRSQEDRQLPPYYLRNFNHDV